MSGDADAIERILRQRAEILAREPEPETGGDRKEYLVFACASKTMAVAEEFAREVVPAHGIFPVPGAPAHVVGGVNHRGRIVAVLSLPILMGMPQDAADRDAHPFVIVLQAAGEGGAVQEAGFLASSLAGFKGFAPDEIGGLRGSTLNWVAGMSGAGILLLDAGPLLEAIVNGSGLN